MTIFDFQPNTKKFYIIHSRDPILLLTKKQSWKVEQNNAATKEGTVQLGNVSGILLQVISKITSFPNSFHGQGRS